MTDRLVLGTAGHVDHGKTSLVKSLTGTDTDRLEEEKRRGITIDLGFADLALGDLQVSIVDVPGHEDFVRNMVAGATGVDAALLVIAADEGFMPQTLEHLAILEFLRVPVGIPVITKVDLVEDEWLDLVQAEVADLLGASSVAWLDAVLFSATTGLGLDELKNSIRVAASRELKSARGELFRMPVDRSFTVVGAGTVVTGTVWSGSVKQGDSVTILPGGTSSRIRAIQSHGTDAAAATPGRRNALALTGVARSEVPRGEVVVADDVWRSTDAIDVAIRLSPGARPLGQRTRVRVHLGTAEVMARVTPADGEISPGELCGARLRLEAPVVARWGDRGVIRTYSPMSTIGGFTVVDPFPPVRPRRPVHWESKMSDSVETRTAGFVEADGHISKRDLLVRLGFGPEEVEWINGSASGLMDAGDVFLAIDGVESRIAAAHASLARFHEDHPLDPGMPLEKLRTFLGRGSSADAILGKWSREARVEIEKGKARLPGFAPTLDPGAAQSAAKIIKKVTESRFHGVNLKELPADDDDVKTADILGFLARSGALIRVGSERYYAAEVMSELIDVVVRATDGGGEVSPADLREQTGLTRKYLIPLLEWMDGEGITARKGDVRLLGPKGQLLASGPVDKG